MVRKSGDFSPFEAGPAAKANNVIDLRQYLRGGQDADVALDDAPPRRDADARLTARQSDINHQVRSMFLDAVELPVPEQLANLVNQFGLEVGADEGRPGVDDRDEAAGSATTRSGARRTSTAFLKLHSPRRETP